MYVAIETLRLILEDLQGVKESVLRDVRKSPEEKKNEVRGIESAIDIIIDRMQQKKHYEEKIASEGIEVIDRAIDSAKCRVYRVREIDGHPDNSLNHQKRARDKEELMKVTIMALECYKEFIVQKHKDCDEAIEVQYNFDDSPCYECGLYGDDYLTDEDGSMVSRCDTCAWNSEVEE